MGMREGVWFRVFGFQENLEENLTPQKELCF